MKRRIAVLAVLLACLVTSQASAGGLGEVLFGRGPVLRDRLRPNGAWDITVRDPRTGVPEVYDIGTGEPVPFAPDMTIEGGLVAVMQPLADTGDRRAARLSIRRGLETLVEMSWGKNALDAPTIAGQVGAHLIAPPGWELAPGRGGKLKLARTSLDVSEEEWVVETTKMVAKKGWKLAVTAGLTPYVFVNTRLLPQGGSTFQFCFAQAGKGALQGGDSVGLSVFRLRDAQTGEELNLDEETYAAVPQGTACFGITSPETRRFLGTVADLPDLSETPADVEQGILPAYLGQLARQVGATGFDPADLRPRYFNVVGGSCGDQPFVLTIVKDGRLVKSASFRLIVNGRTIDLPADDGADEALVVPNLPPGARVAAVVDGQAWPEVMVQPGQGIWYPVVVDAQYR